MFLQSLLLSEEDTFCCRLRPVENTETQTLISSTASFFLLYLIFQVRNWEKKISLFHSFAVFSFMFCYSLNFLFIHLFPHEHVHRWITSVMLDEITPPLEFSSCSSFDSYTPDEGELSENVIGKSCVLNIAIIIKSLQNHPFLFGQIGDCSLNSINHALMSFTAPSGASGLNLFLC